MSESPPAGPRPTALVTGASSGIGLELARLFAAGGHDLVLVARRRERLLEAAAELVGAHGGQVHAVAADLADPGAPEAVAAEAARGGGAVAALVNCAGFGASGRFADADLRDQLEMVRVNVAALTHLTGLLLPGMVRRRAGRILNVASTAAFQPGPGMAVYYATKAYVLSFSEALASELQGSGVTVTTLCPGPTDTGFQARAGVESTDLFRRARVMDVRAVALAGYAGCMAGRGIVIPGLYNRALAQAVRFLPRAWVLRFVKRLNSKAAR